MDGGYQCRDHRRQGISASGGHEGSEEDTQGAAVAAPAAWAAMKAKFAQRYLLQARRKVVTFTVILNGERAWGVCLGVIASVE